MDSERLDDVALRGPDLAEGMGVADSDVSAEGSENPLDMTVFERIAEITDLCAGIKKEKVTIKTKESGTYSFDGHMAEGVLAAVRPLLSKYRLVVLPVEFISIQYAGNRCDVMIKWRWQCVTSEYDAYEISWPGADTDRGGKALTKAETNSMKEMFKKVLKITDRDDAKEETDNVEFQSDEQVSRAAVEGAKEQARQVFESWAMGYRKNIRTAEDVKALRRLKAENATTLSNPDLPTATRAFLETEYAEREKLLKDLEAEAEANEETLA